MINERSRAFRRLSSRALFRSDGDRRHSARNGFDIERVVVAETNPFAGRKLLIFDFRGFWSKLDAAVTQASTSTQHGGTSRRSLAGPSSGSFATAA